MNRILEKLKVPEIIRTDLSNNSWIFGLLCIGFLPMALRGYAQYLLVFLTPLLFKTKYGINTLLILVFSFLYTSSMLYRGVEMITSEMVFSFLYPLLLYQTGEYLGKHVKSVRTITLLMVCISIAMALPAIFSNVLDYLSTGELINSKRAVEAASGESSGATRYGMMLALSLGSIGAVIIGSNDNFDNKLKVVILGFSLLSLLSTIHLVNRSGLYIAAFSVVACAVLPPFTPKRVVYALIIFVVAYIIYVVYLEFTPLLKKAIESYQYRNETQGSVKSFGGRDNLWRQGIQHLEDYPWGGGKSVVFHGRASYAHNMWLDCGIVGGVPAMILLIVITCKYVISAVKLLFYKTRYTFSRNLLIVMFATLIIQSMVEPVLLGLPQFFWIMMLLFGMLTMFLKKEHESADA